jgi:hypothetical protein
MEKADPSSANVPQLTQTFADVVALKPIPRFFFFTGDLVVNQATDNGQTLEGQLNAWSLLFFGDRSKISHKTTLVPLPGNHELLQEISINTSIGKVKVEIPNPPTDDVWVDWITQNGFAQFAGNGPTPTPPNPDMLLDDQSKLSYSFNVDDTHFVLLNTDTYAVGGNTGWIAYNWAAQDIVSAQRNHKIKSIFVLGHKPIVSPLPAAGDGDAILNPLGFQLYVLLSSTPKVKAYLCSHAHLWQISQLGGSHGVWQVVAGNGGSTLESGLQPAQQFYGFTLVKLYESGVVGITSYARPVPTPYFAPHTTPAKPQPEIFIQKLVW